MNNNVPQFIPDNQADKYFGKSNVPTFIPDNQADQFFKQPVSQETLGNPTFPANQNEGVGTSSLKTLGNMPSSTVNFAKGVIDFLNPIKTVSNLKQQAEQIGTEMGQNPDVKVSPLDVVKEMPKNAYNMLVPDAFKNLIKGDYEQARQDIVNDPVGQIAPFLLVGEGGLKTLDRAGITKEASTAFEQGISDIAKPVTKTLEGAKNVAQNVATSASSYVTGLDKPTIQRIIENPEAFSKIARDNIDRGNLAGEVQVAINKRLADLSETGKGYEKIRQTQGVVQIPQTTIADILKKYNIELVDGKVKTGVESTPLSPTDINKLQHFIDIYGNEFQLSNNAFLNARSALSDLSKYEQGTTGRLQTISRDLRGAYDLLGKGQMSGLKELDAVYAPEVSFLKQIKKDYINKDGTFKDGAVNKIANATKEGKENLLGRLEEVMPGITKRIQILKAVEDIEKVSGLKQFQYSKIMSKIMVGGAGYALGGIYGTVLAEIISNPAIAVPLLRGYGFTKNQMGVVTAYLKAFAGDVNTKLTGQLEKGIEDYIKNPKMGLTLEDISKTQSNILPKTPEMNNATDIAKNASNIPKVSNNTNNLSSESNLINEAKKYKSAEEFASKQINAYHGTNADFDTFSKDFIGENQVVDFGQGFYFAKDKKSALGYAKEAGGNKVMEVKLDIKNPAKNKDLLARDVQNAIDDEMGFTDVGEVLKKKGFDGIEYTRADGSIEYTVFDPEQIKTKSQLIDIWKKANKK